MEPSNSPDNNQQPPTQPDGALPGAVPGTNAADRPQADAPMQKVAEHALTNGELVLFSEMYQSFEKLRTLIAMFLCEKHGYPENEPVGFEFNWKNKTVSVFRPGGQSKLEVTSDAPAPPAPNQTV